MDTPFGESAGLQVIKILLIGPGHNSPVLGLSIVAFVGPI